MVIYTELLASAKQSETFLNLELFFIKTIENL